MSPTPLARADVAALARLLWAPSQPTQDVDRWLQQGFVFAPPSALSAFPLGLVQGHGGPCGVLAAVQAELVCAALFPSRTDLSLDARRARLVTKVDADAQRAALVQALATVLGKCNKSVIRIVSREDDDKERTFLDGAFHEITVAPADAPSILQLLLPALSGPHGVVLFVFSLLRTKGIEAIRQEMDDVESALTGQFGHCGQELLNLLLTGVATSNVFDGSVPMGDTGLVLRGIQARPTLGYLSQLEALRYCHVGDYYKSPQTPVWVIGSASHFSVAFGVDEQLCEESASLMLLQRLQRVFKAFDPMESGFMDMGSLADSLRQLGVAHEIVASEYAMAQLCSRLEVPGAGIILWDEYWRLVSVLVHTGDVELALSGKYHEAKEGDAARPKTDEELARELQAQFDAEESGQPTTSTSAGGSASVVANSDRAPRDTKERFQLYYYNGLSKKSEENVYPALKKADVEVEAMREFIGDTIPIELSTASGHGGHAGHPLEDILHTKWPSATFTWEGSSVPSAD